MQTRELRLLQATTRDSRPGTSAGARSAHFHILNTALQTPCWPRENILHNKSAAARPVSRQSVFRGAGVASIEVDPAGRWMTIGLGRPSFRKEKPANRKRNVSTHWKVAGPPLQSPPRSLDDAEFSDSTDEELPPLGMTGTSIQEFKELPAHIIDEDRMSIVESLDAYSLSRRDQELHDRDKQLEACGELRRMHTQFLSGPVSVARPSKRLAYQTKQAVERKRALAAFMEATCSRLQAVWKGRTTRRYLLKLHARAFLIEAAYRWHRAKESGRLRRKSAIMIQACIRGHITRCQRRRLQWKTIVAVTNWVLWAQSRFGQMVKSCKRIQTIYRRYRTMKLVAAMRRAYNQAAANIQKLRWYIPITPARTLLALKQRQARGARAMQRMFRARRWYDWTQAAICIQAHTRRFEAQLLLGRLRSAALEHELKRREQEEATVQAARDAVNAEFDDFVQTEAGAAQVQELVAKLRVLVKVLLGFRAGKRSLFDLLSHYWGIHGKQLSALQRTKANRFDRHRAPKSAAMVDARVEAASLLMFALFDVDRSGELDEDELCMLGNELGLGVSRSELLERVQATISRRDDDHELEAASDPSEEPLLCSWDNFREVLTSLIPSAGPSTQTAPSAAQQPLPNSPQRRRSRLASVVGAFGKLRSPTSKVAPQQEMIVEEGDPGDAGPSTPTSPIPIRLTADMASPPSSMKRWYYRQRYALQQRSAVGTGASTMEVLAKRLIREQQLDEANDIAIRRWRTEAPPAVFCPVCLTAFALQALLEQHLACGGAESAHIALERAMEVLLAACEGDKPVEKGPAVYVSGKSPLTCRSQRVLPVAARLGVRAAAAQSPDKPV